MFKKISYFSHEYFHQQFIIQKVYTKTAEV